MNRRIKVLQTSALPLGYGAKIFIKIKESKLSAPTLWSGIRDSNPQLSPWQGDTLPIELIPQIVEKLYYIILQLSIINFKVNCW